MTLRVWCELVPQEEYGLSSPSGLIARVKYSPILRSEIEDSINYHHTYSNYLYRCLDEDPTLVFEFKNVSDFLGYKLEYEKGYHYESY